MKAIFFCVIASFSLLAGCQKPANNPPTPPTPTAPKAAEPKPFVVKESAYVVHPSTLDDTIYLLWTAVLENPNPDMFGLGPTLTITARDDAGTVVGTEDQMFHEMTPGGTVAFSSQLTVTKTPKTVEFTVGKTRWKAAPKPASAYPAIATTGVSMKPDQMAGGYVVVGEFINPYPVALENTVVTALFRDESGKLIGGGSSFVANAPASGARPFSVEHVGINGTPAKVDVVVTTWAGTDLIDLIK